MARCSAATCAHRHGPFTRQKHRACAAKTTRRRRLDRTSRVQMRGHFFPPTKPLSYRERLRSLEEAVAAISESVDRLARELENVTRPVRGRMWWRGLDAAGYYGAFVRSCRPSGATTNRLSECCA